MKLSEFNYSYPEELVAKYPLSDRDASRMMVLDRASSSILHSKIKELSSFLKKGDVLVINNSRVLPARLIGKKESGGYYEVLLLGRTKDEGRRTWRCITNQTKGSKPGLVIHFGDELIGTMVAREEDELIIEFNCPELIEKVGLPPLPPYILAARKKSSVISDQLSVTDDRSPITDHQRYQTVYADEIGSSAAPTAGLHFTDRLLSAIHSVGVEIAPVTLHVGLDTFSPVRADNIEEHKMHGEEYSISEASAEAITAAKKEGRRVIAVGTTSARVLESYGQTGKATATTNIFIYPGYKFKVVDAMLTNFHQPESTLIVMVSAFAGREFIMKAYTEAIAQKYRLFSYGDCMLIR